MSKFSVRHYTADTMKQIMDNKDNVSNGSFIFCEENERLYIKMKDKVLAITPKKKAKTTNCRNCGAPLKIIPSTYESIIKCEYCGTVFDCED